MSQLPRLCHYNNDPIKLHSCFHIVKVKERFKKLQKSRYVFVDMVYLLIYHHNFKVILRLQNKNIGSLSLMFLLKRRVSCTFSAHECLLLSYIRTNKLYTKRKHITRANIHKKTITTYYHFNTKHPQQYMIQHARI